MQNIKSLALALYTMLVAYGMFEFKTPWVLVALIGLMLLAVMQVDKGGE